MSWRVALLTAVVFAALVCSEGWSCPDGCTDAQEIAAHHQPQGSSGSCLLCLGGIAPPPDADVFALGPASSDIILPPMRAQLDIRPDPPTHPPRL